MCSLTSIAISSSILELASCSLVRFCLDLALKTALPCNVSPLPKMLVII